jgi:hypothetical protein
MIASLSVMFYSTTRRLASSSTNAKKIIVKISSDCITASYRFIGNEPPQLRSFKLELVAWMHLVCANRLDSSWNRPRETEVIAISDIHVIEGMRHAKWLVVGV